MGYSPEIAPKGRQAVRDEIREWKLYLRIDLSLEEISKQYNPVVKGWLQHYARFNRAELNRTLGPLDYALCRWARRKIKTLKRHSRKASRWIAEISRREYRLFAHWAMWHQQRSMLGAV